MAPYDKEKKPKYELSAKIGDFDISPRITNVSIFNSVDIYNQVFSISFITNDKELLSNNITGESPVKLRIERLADGKNVDEQFDFQLIAFDIENTQSRTYGLNEPVPPNSIECTIKCAIEKAWLGLATPVNFISPPYSPITPFEAAKAIVDRFVKGVTKDIDTIGINNYRPRNIVVNPCRLSKALEYINEEYGIYSGVCSFAFVFEDNELKFRLYNLTKRIAKPPEYTILVIPPGFPVPSEAYSIAGILDNFFYTFEPSEKIIDSNASLAQKGGGSSVYINKTSKNLFERIEVKPNELFDKALPKSKGQARFNPSLKKTAEFETIDFAGKDNPTATILSDLARITYDQFKCLIKLKGILKLKNLFKTGITVSLMDLHDEGKSISGPYLVKSTSITLKKENGLFECSSNVLLCRSNIPHQDD